MNVRIRRLQADYDQIRKGLQQHQAINIRGVSGNPPDRYQIEYNLRSLVENADGSVKERHQHVAEIYLTLAYPRQAPQCRMLTPVFHPNIAPHAICIGDHWAAGESLLNLIIRIGEMLAFQSYNVKSPLNGSAARWADEHSDMLPTDARDFTTNSVPPPSEAKEPAAASCSNCRAANSLHECPNGHIVCEDCMIQCAGCGKTFCLMCRLETCPICSSLICEQCQTSCPQCKRNVCASHIEVCATCGKPGCVDCTIECSVCGAKACLEHIAQCAQCRAILCAADTHTCTKCNRKYCATHFDTSTQECHKCQSTTIKIDEPAEPIENPSMEISCVSCTFKFQTPVTSVGRYVQCSQCGEVFKA